ncbi:MAG: ACT domain-containing protein, partial [Candidatus Woesearchaeota archaeon]
QYGDEIIAIKTKEGKYTIHKKTCVNQFSTPREQTIILNWKVSDTGNEYTLNISFVDRVGLLADILNAISSRKINITFVKSKKTKRGNMLTFQLVCDDPQKIEDLKQDLKKISNILGFEFNKERFSEIIKNLLSKSFGRKQVNDK